MTTSDPHLLKAIYDKNVPRFEAARTHLVQRLEAVLSEYNTSQYFRVRLTEARVKAFDGLYQKVVKKKCSLDDVFQKPGTIRDLIGARIVCHNLEDINDIYRVIHETFQVREMVDGPKDYVSSPNKDTGYRARHIDVPFELDGESYQAEIQIRTLLQDAWATFMHDDVYKGPLRRFFSENLAQLFRGSNDAIHGLDQMAQSLRSYVESNPVDPTVKSSVGDKLQLHMNTFVDFAQNATQSDIQYSDVQRIDKYFIDGVDGRYDFYINANSDVASIFEFLLGGDTGMSGCKDIKLYRAERAPKSMSKMGPGAFELVEHEVIQSTDNMLKIREVQPRKRRRHTYRITCTWEDVFKEDVEYIFAPWGPYYSSANVEYAIQIVCDRGFNHKPRLYFQDSGSGLLSAVLDDYIGQTFQLGEAMTYVNEANRYESSYDKLDKVMYCLMVLK